MYVTDTGNKRVQVFGLDGTFIRMFGGAGSGPGQFNEEVGLALDADGNVWVADTWNNRIQELEPQRRAARASSRARTAGRARAVTNKPYLAVDATGPDRR